MPAGTVHFNGSVNLADARAVFTEITRRVPHGLRRLPDGETGERSNWILFQLQRFAESAQLVQSARSDHVDYDALPRFELAGGATALDVSWPDLGYAHAYQNSYETFRSLKNSGAIPADVRFQVQYPTPLASIASWIVPEQQMALEESYERALFADLSRLVASIPHDELAVQWDVAVEFGILERCLPADPSLDRAALVDRIARCAANVPADVPVGLHLCYGDLGHQHFTEPRSLELQVSVVNDVQSRLRRSLGWVSFTVPQNRADAPYFAPLEGLTASQTTEFAFGIVPYHPDEQAPGVTALQAAAIDAALGGERTWSVSAECGMGRIEPDEVLRLLDLHEHIRTIRASSDTA